MTYYGIYKITNLLNGKMYIGRHKTTNLDDGYMGSGICIRNAVQKYGIDNFRKEWLMFCEDEEELNYMERVFVDQTWVDRSDTYNLCLGGDCRPISELTKQKLSDINKGRKLSVETKKRISSALKGRPTYMKGRHHTEETKKRIQSSSRKSSNTGKWSKNHTPWNKGKHDMHYFNNGTINILASKCPEGFVAGRLLFKKKEGSK